MTSSAIDSLPVEASIPRNAASESSPPELPETPLVIIERDKRLGIDLRVLWGYRELLYFFVWRDLKVRYKQTILGVTWAVMQPLMLTLIFTVFLGYLARVPSNGVPYSLFVFAGILPWTFVSGSLVASGMSLVANANLVTKVYFPRIIVPAAAICGRLVDFIVSLVLFAIVLVFYNVGLTRNIWILPFVILLSTTLSFAVGMWASAVNVKYRDVTAVLPVAVQLWMFTSPVVYPASMIQARNIDPIWRWAYKLNPMVGIIEGFRAAVLGTPIDWPALVTATIVTLVLFVYASYSFRRLEASFADII